jgi:hypothetical protein
MLVFRLQLFCWEISLHVFIFELTISADGVQLSLADVCAETRFNPQTIKLRTHSIFNKMITLLSFTSAAMDCDIYNTSTISLHKLLHHPTNSSIWEYKVSLKLNSHLQLL